MRFGLIIGFLIVAAFAGVQAQTHDADAVSGASSTDFRAGLERETFFLVNQYREAHGLPPLVWDEAITKVAREHSKDMATGEVDFGHDGFRDRVNHLKSIMAGFQGAGENVLMSSDPEGAAKNAVTMWLHSPHHLENIRGDYNYSGLGVSQDKDGTIYFTQIFMKFAPVTEQAQAAPAPTGISSPFGMLATPNTRTRP